MIVTHFFANGLLGFLQMMVAALGTLLIGRLPQHSALSMVVVVASLALALVFGLLALRGPAQRAAGIDDDLRPRPSCFAIG